MPRKTREMHAHGGMVHAHEDPHGAWATPKLSKPSAIADVFIVARSTDGVLLCTDEAEPRLLYSAGDEGHDARRLMRWARNEPYLRKWRPMEVRRYRYLPAPPRRRGDRDLR